MSRLTWGGYGRDTAPTQGGVFRMRPYIGFPVPATTTLFSIRPRDLEVERSRWFAGCEGELGNIEQFAKDLEVARLQRSGVFLHFVEVRIDAPLADLVGDDGDVVCPDEPAVIGCGLRPMIEAQGNEPLQPCFLIDVKLVRG